MVLLVRRVRLVPIVQLVLQIRFLQLVLVLLGVPVILHCPRVQLPQEVPMGQTDQLVRLAQMLRQHQPVR